MSLSIHSRPVGCNLSKREGSWQMSAISAFASAAAAQKRADSATLLAASLNAALSQVESRLEQLERKSRPTNERAPPPALDVARLSAQVQNASQESFRLSDALLKSKHTLERSELETKDEGAAALLQLREQLSTAHDADRAILMREMGELQSRVNSIKALSLQESSSAERRILEVRNAVDTEVDAQLDKLLSTRFVDVSKLRDAEGRAARLEQEAPRLRAQNDSLREEVTRLEHQDEVTRLEHQDEVTRLEHQDEVTRLEHQGWLSAQIDILRDEVTRLEHQLRKAIESAAEGAVDNNMGRSGSVLKMIVFGKKLLGWRINLRDEVTRLEHQVTEACIEAVDNRGRAGSVMNMISFGMTRPGASGGLEDTLARIEKAAAEVSELNDVKELTTTAVGGLEDTLARIEKAAAEVSELNDVEELTTTAVAGLEDTMARIDKAAAVVSELNDVKELTTTAVAGLEDTLARIEKAAAEGAVNGRGRAGSALGRGALRVAVKAGAECADENTPTSLPALSKELVRAKLAESEAVRKLRATARTEVDLRSQLLQRDQRIDELKESLSKKSRAYEDARKRVQGYSKVAAAASSRSPSPSGRRRSLDLSSSTEAPLPRGGPRGKGGPLSLRHPPFPSHLKPSRARTPDRESQGGFEMGDEVEVMKAELHTLSAEVVLKRAELARLEDAACDIQADAKVQSAMGQQHMKGVEESLVNAELAGAMATLNSLLRKLQGNSTDSQQAPTFRPNRQLSMSADEWPRARDIPARLAAAADELSVLVSDQLMSDRYGFIPTCWARARAGMLGWGLDAGLVLGSWSGAGMLVWGWDAGLGLGCWSGAGMLVWGWDAGLGLGCSAGCFVDCTSFKPRCNVIAHALTIASAIASSLRTSRASSRRELRQERDTLASSLRQQQEDHEMQSQQRNHILRLQHANSTQRPQNPAPPRIEPPHHRAPPNSGNSIRNAEALMDLLRRNVPSILRECQRVEDAASSVVNDRSQGAPSTSVAALSELRASVSSLMSDATAAEATLGLLEAALSKMQSEEDASTPAWHAQPTDLREEEDRHSGEDTSPTTSRRQSRSRYDLPAPGRRSLELSGRRRSSGGFDAGDRVGTEQVDMLAQRLREQHQKATKWKDRCRELGHHFASASAAAAAKDAAATERMHEADLQMDVMAARHKAEVQRLQAALAGAQAARSSLQRATAAQPCTGTSSAPAPERNTADLKAAHSRLAESQAHATSIRKQLEADQAKAHATISSLQDEVQRLKRLETDQAKAHATISSLQDKVQRLKVSSSLSNSPVNRANLSKPLCLLPIPSTRATISSLQDEVQRLESALAQEQGERAKMMSQMRETLCNMRSAKGEGDEVDMRLKAELMKSHQATATACATRDRAEAQVAWV
eukprot:gene1826-33245_t